MRELAITVGQGVSAVSRWIDRLIAGVCVAVIYVMLVLLLTQVVMRYFLGSPPSWTEELAIILFTWLVLLFASSGIRNHFHVALDTIPERLVRLRFVSDLVVQTLVVVFGVVMITAGYAYVNRTLPQNTAALQIPIGFLYSSIPVSGCLILLHSVSNILEQIFGLSVKKESTNQDNS